MGDSPKQLIFKGDYCGKIQVAILNFFLSPLIHDSELNTFRQDEK